MVDCPYADVCTDANTEKCKRCKHNRRRSYFEPVEDSWKWNWKKWFERHRPKGVKNVWREYFEKGGYVIGGKPYPVEWIRRQ